MKKVSVLIPAFNRARYIGETLRCVLGQDYRNLEVLVINDASTDDTVKIVESFADSRIRLVHNPQNLGLAGVRNRLLELATGDFLAWQDSDDLCSIDRISEQVRFLDLNPSVLAVGSMATLIDDNGASLSGMHLNPCFEKPDSIAISMCFEDPLTNSSVMMRKSVCDLAKFDLAFPPYEDYDFWERVSWHGKLANISKPLIKYRRHSAQSSHEANLAHDKRHHAVIWSRRLNRIGVSADLFEKYFPVHWELARGNYWSNYKTIQPLLEWLTIIINANRKTKCLNVKALVCDLKRRVDILSNNCPHNKISAGLGLYACCWMTGWLWRVSLTGYLCERSKLLPSIIRQRGSLLNLRRELGNSL